MDLSEPKLKAFWEQYGNMLNDWEHYPKKLIYYFKLWSYRDEQNIRSNALVPREPGECTARAE